MGFPEETDTGILRWPALLRGMQFIGAFPYDISQLCPPKLSVSLFLWSIFFNSLVFAMFFVSVRYSIIPLMTPEIGNMVFIYSLCLMMIVLLTSPLALLLKSKSLASFLVCLAPEEEHNSKSTKVWYKNKSILILCALTPTYLGMSVYYNYYIMKMQAIGEIIFFLWSFLSFMPVITLPLLLCEKVFDVLTIKLVASTDRALTFASKNMVRHKYDLAEIIRSFQVMERDVLKVRYDYIVYSTGNCRNTY